jgi:hypothetical protein
MPLTTSAGPASMFLARAWELYHHPAVCGNRHGAVALVLDAGGQVTTSRPFKCCMWPLADIVYSSRFAGLIYCCILFLHTSSRSRFSNATDLSSWGAGSSCPSFLQPFCGLLRCRTPGPTLRLSESARRPSGGTCNGALTPSPGWTSGGRAWLLPFRGRLVVLAAPRRAAPRPGQRQGISTSGGGGCGASRLRDAGLCPLCSHPSGSLRCCVCAGWRACVWCPSFSAAGGPDADAGDQHRRSAACWEPCHGGAAWLCSSGNLDPADVFGYLGYLLIRPDIYG